MKKQKEPIIIDLMSSPRAVRDLYNSGYHGRLLAVGFNDFRTTMERKNDAEHNISFIKGDLAKSDTFKQIQQWLGDKKAHLIMERGFAGLHFIPTRLNYQKAVLSKFWDMIDPEGGLMVLQKIYFTINYPLFSIIRASSF